MGKQEREQLRPNWKNKNEKPLKEEANLHLLVASYHNKRCQQANTKVTNLNKQDFETVCYILAIVKFTQ